MITKLPRWVWAGGSALAFIAGIVNVVALLGFEHQAVTHLTGTTSQVATAIAQLEGWMALHLFAVILSFVGGAMLSGMIVKDSTLKLGRSYGIALILESLLLVAAVPLLRRESAFGVYCASCACGLQNAMASTYSGAVVRTTHLSGMFTDLGMFLGQVLRGVSVDRRRLTMCFAIISGFFAGSAVGALTFRAWDYSALLVPAGLTALASAAYGTYTLSKRPRP